MITELIEEEFYNLEEGKNTGIFYFKSEWPRWYCVVMLPNQKPYRNVWNVEELAFNWMNKFTKHFENE